MYQEQREKKALQEHTLTYDDYSSINDFVAIA